MPTYEEWQEEHIKAQEEQMKKNAKELEEATKDTIEGGPNGAETAEQYAERIAAVRSTMIFGDTDTTAGAGAVGTDVPSADNEGASVAAAKVDAGQVEGGDDAAEGVTHDEARRQIDVDAGTTASAEEVEAGAEARDEHEGEGDVIPSKTDEGHKAQQEAVSKTRSRSRK